MKTLCSIAVVGLMVLLMAAPCAEAAQDGNELLAACRDGIRVHDTGGIGSSTEAFNAGYCSGFVNGMIAMHAVARSLLHGSSLFPLFCLPEPAIRGIQAMRIVLHYLETHPER